MSKDYQFSDDMLDEYESLVGYPNDVVDEKENPEYVKSGGYKALSVILTILGIGGLFVGLLSAVSELFAPLVEADVDGMLNNTLLGVLLQVLRDLAAQAASPLPRSIQRRDYRAMPRSQPIICILSWRRRSYFPFCSPSLH